MSERAWQLTAWLGAYNYYVEGRSRKLYQHWGANGWIARLLTRQMPRPLISLGAKRQLYGCVSPCHSVSWSVAIAKAGLRYPVQYWGFLLDRQRHMGGEITKTSKTCGREVSHTHTRLSLSKKKTKKQTAPAVLDKASDFISCGRRRSTGRDANESNSGKCCCCDKAERGGREEGEEGEGHPLKKKVTPQGRSWQMEPETLRMRSCIPSADKNKIRKK